MISTEKMIFYRLQSRSIFEEELVPNRCFLYQRNVESLFVNSTEAIVEDIERKWFVQKVVDKS